MSALYSSFYVALGGALGSLLRFWVGRGSVILFPSLAFPLGTLIVNLVGCFVIGFFSAYLQPFYTERPELLLFLITGLLGGFTTFSAFGLELYDLLRRSDFFTFALYLGVSVFGGVLLAFLGWRVGGSN